MRVNGAAEGQGMPESFPFERAHIAPLLNCDSLVYSLTPITSIDVSYLQELAWLRQSNGQTKLGTP